VRLRWTRLAVTDLDSVYAYIAVDAPDAAMGIIDRIEEATAVLIRHPESGRAGRIKGTRELVVAGTPFILLYRIRQGTIQILAVIHGARKWPESV